MRWNSQKPATARDISGRSAIAAFFACRDRVSRQRCHAVAGSHAGWRSEISAHTAGSRTHRHRGSARRLRCPVPRALDPWPRINRPHRGPGPVAGVAGVGPGLDAGIAKHTARFRRCVAGAACRRLRAWRGRLTRPAQAAAGRVADGVLGGGLFARPGSCRHPKD